MERPEFKSRRDKIAWYLDEIDCYKEDMGKWYTMFIRRFLPFMVFFLPMLILSAYAYQRIFVSFMPGLFHYADQGPTYIIWAVSLVVFLLILIFLPRFATFCEFVMGISYLVLIFHLGGFTDTALGYFTVIVLSIFVFMKFVFLIVEIMYLIVFHGEKEAKAYIDDTDVVF